MRGRGRTRITLLSQLVVAEADQPGVLTPHACFGTSLSLSLACLIVSYATSPLAKKRGGKKLGRLSKKKECGGLSLSVVALPSIPILLPSVLPLSSMSH